MLKKTFFLALLICCSLAYGADDVLIADFEGDDYGSWQVRGECFGEGPAKGTLEGQQDVTGFKGDGLVNSFLYEGDTLEGVLISPSFKIERKYINFLIGGGRHPSRAGVTLEIDGETARAATGDNSERLRWATFDVSEFRGQEGVIRIIDQIGEDWGHINVDHIVQSDVAKSEGRIDEKPVMRNKTLTRKMKIRKKYINLPVVNDNVKQRIRLLLDGRIVRELVIALGDGEADYWVVADVSEFKGKELTIESRGMVKDDEILDQLKQADHIIGGENIYSERLRPQFHFTSKRGWNNDTNGMVYYDGEYHMFYQHNPYGWPWGNMTWGHAVSTDMIHWEEIGDAIHPDEMGTIFSGGAVVDNDNTAGFKTGEEDVIVCFYTSAGGTNPWSQEEPFTQSIAYSNDRGRTFTKYEGNPIIEHIRGGNRDPKVIWHEPSGQWVLVLYIEESEMGFFTSKDLKSWELQSRLKSFHECPELFELPVDGDEDNKKWILYGASGHYSVGTFDGKEFEAEDEAITFNYGNAFYASQTFSDIPEEDGRRLMMGWGQVPMIDMPFNQMITFPVELTLRSTDQGVRMFAEPVKEVEKLHKKKYSFTDETVDGTETLPGIDGELLHIKAEFEVGEASSFGLVVREFKITYNAEQERIICEGGNDIGLERFSEPRSVSLKPVDGKISLEILVDRTMLEIFPNDGRYYFPMGAYLVDKDPAVKVFSEGGSTKVNCLKVYELESIWK